MSVAIDIDAAHSMPDLSTKTPRLLRKPTQEIRSSSSPRLTSTGTQTPEVSIEIQGLATTPPSLSTSQHSSFSIINKRITSIVKLVLLCLAILFSLASFLSLLFKDDAPDGHKMKQLFDTLSNINNLAGIQGTNNASS